MSATRRSVITSLAASALPLPAVPAIAAPAAERVFLIRGHPIDPRAHRGLWGVEVDGKVVARELHRHEAEALADRLLGRQ